MTGPHLSALSLFCMTQCATNHLSSLCITQIAELCHEIEDRDDALAKAREAAHKAQLQKYQASIAFF